MRLLATALLTLSLFATACGGSSSSGSGEGGGSGSSFSANGLECELLSSELLSELIGPDFQALDGARDGLSRSATSECDWQVPLDVEPAGNFKRIQLATVTQSSIDQAVDALSAEPVAGLGDEAWRVSLSEGSSIFTYHVKIADSGYRLDLSLDGSDGADPLVLKDTTAERIFAEVAVNR